MVPGPTDDVTRRTRLGAGAAADFFDPSGRARAASRNTIAVKTYRALVRSIVEFEQTLDSSLEVAVRLSGFPDLTLRLRHVSHAEPDIIKIYGESPAGEDVQITQHVSQLNALLTRMAAADAAPRRIGQQLEAALQ